MFEAFFTFDTGYSPIALALSLSLVSCSSVADVYVS